MITTDGGTRISTVISDTDGDTISDAGTHGITLGHTDYTTHGLMDGIMVTILVHGDITDGGIPGIMDITDIMDIMDIMADTQAITLATEIGMTGCTLETHTLEQDSSLHLLLPISV